MRPPTLYHLLVLGLLSSIAGCTEPTSVTRELSIDKSSQSRAEVPKDYVATPAGWYHRSCVHEIEQGALVDKSGWVTRRDGTTYQIPKCLYPSRGVRPRTRPSSPSNEGWIEYAFTNEPSGNSYTQITAQWTVPAAPDDPLSGSQVYFTFPGLQSSAFIIQPVIQYGHSSAGGGNFWTMASWHCNGDCRHSPLTTIAAGDAISGAVVASNCANGDCTWTITTEDVTSGQQTVLSLTDTENYAWAAGGAVEVYGLTHCNEWPKSGVFYSGIALYDRNLTQVSPSWSTYIEPEPLEDCSFRVDTTATSVNLYHNGGLTACVPGGFPWTPCGGGGAITSVTGSGTINLADDGGHTGTITLSGATASGGLTACVPGGFPWSPCGGGGAITSMTVSGTNVINLTDDGGNTGTITLSGVTAW